jgi:hypothetical protein
MSETIYYKTITISTGSFVQIELAVRKEIAYLERQVESGDFMSADSHNFSVRRLADLRAALVEFSA